MTVKKEFFQCSTCGSYIDPETGETHYKSGSNAETLNQLREKIKTLQHDLLRLKEENDSLKGEKKGEKPDNGKEPDDTEPDGESGFWKGILD